ncbi:MAG TPA: MCP four helix bundle domain-containing protein [Myxococcota bacterium]|nr:MCP four helix bundle domain-containing protein [Myxococcota bacterium]
MSVGAALVLLLALLVLLFGKPPGPDPRLALKAHRLDLVHRMQLGLASASEAEKSAVLAITDQESQAFGDQARANTTDVDRERKELEALLDQGGTPKEKELLAEFSQQFAELQRVDDELLGLAGQNSNLKAYALTFGAAADALQEMTAALSRVVAANSDARDAKEVMSLALGAEIAALRIQTLLPPHIAEAKDSRMDELEASMTREDEQVQSDLERLKALPGIRGGADLDLAASRYGQFRQVKSQILALSRENTNVRSLAISLNQKRKLRLSCDDVLGKLQDVLEKEPIEGVTYGGRLGVR